jgi:hypothetical protein
MSDPGDDRTLEDRAEELQERVRKLEEASGSDNRESQRYGAIGKRWQQVRKYLGPLGWLISQVGRWLKWVLFVPAENDGRMSFSFRRTFLNLGISIVALIAIHVAFKAIYFYSTYFTETVYVTGKQEVETGELYQFGGCTSLPCSTDSDNGKFYLIKSSLYFPVMFYPEEDVFANIPQQNGACMVEGYGIYFRELRWLYKSAQLYQHVVDVSCRPYTEEEIRRAVEGGQIVDDSNKGSPPATGQ